MWDQLTFISTLERACATQLGAKTYMRVSRVQHGGGKKFHLPVAL